MSASAFLYPILAAAAEMAGGSALKEFAKGAGKSAYDALCARLKSQHGAAAIDLLPQAQGNEAYAAVIRADLDKDSVAQDPEVKALAEALLAAMQEMPQFPAAALDVGEIKAAGNQTFRNIEVMRADRIEAGGDQVFDGITRGKS